MVCVLSRIIDELAAKMAKLVNASLYCWTSRNLIYTLYRRIVTNCIRDIDTNKMLCTISNICTADCSFVYVISINDQPI